MARQEKALIALALTLTFAWLPAPARAIDVQDLNVRYAGGRYIVDFHALLDAPAHAVGAVLTDYEHYPDLDPRILDSERVPAPRGDAPRLLTKLRGCVGALICRSMQRVETLQEKHEGDAGELVATADPAESDVRFGVTTSRWEPRANATAVTYHLELTPSFWVPPLIGRRLMIKTLREGTLSLFTNVERVAREKASVRTGQARPPIAVQPVARNDAIPRTRV